MASGKDTVALQVKIKRYQPEQRRQAEAYWQEFRVEADPHDRLLDVLNKIKWEQDGTLTYRRSCAHGVCGSDAMRVNGRNRLACKLLVQDVGRRITIEPMLGFPVIRDLVVDMDPFFAKYGKVKPYPHQRRAAAAHRAPPVAGAARALRRHDEVHPLRRLHRLLPSVWANREWVGPASIVNAHRFIFDSRDRGAPERLQILGDRNGVWRCRTIFNCTEACPRGIHVTEAIEEVKRAIVYNSNEVE